MRSVLRKGHTINHGEKDVSGECRKQVSIQGKSHQHKVFQKYGTYDKADADKLDDMPSWVLDSAYQHELVDALLSDLLNISDNSSATEWSSLYSRGLSHKDCVWIVSQLEHKMEGYVRQDGEKGEKREKRAMTEDVPTRTNRPSVFNVYDKMTLYDALHKIQEEDYRCHYCQTQVRILYRKTRDKDQWTLDRIDNDRGHDKDNVVVSCYACNIRRRARSYHKFKEEFSVTHFDKLGK